MGGTHYLKDLLALFNGRVDLVLAAYNAGEGTVMKYGNRVPPYAETQSYVRLISKHYLNKNGS
jgi:soluble lytic murein transglycosylase-like protein